MNIWIFNHYAITPGYPGGTRHYELAKNLGEQGHNTVLFAANFIHMNFSTVPVDDTGYTLHRQGRMDFIWLGVREYRRNDWRRFANMRDYCRAARKISLKLMKNGQIVKPDLIIGSTVHPFAAVTASRLARKLGIPFIFEIRDLWPRTFIDMGIWGRNSVQARLFKCIEAYTVKRAKKIITLSPRTQSYLRELYDYPGGDILYIPNGVYTGQPVVTGGAPNDTIARLNEFRGNGTFTVLFSGSLISTNKLETIIDAADLLRSRADIKIVLIGRGQDETRYRDMIAAKGLSNLDILPPVPKDRVPELLSHADALILNQGNVQWGSSNKLYDYMASGRPIISSVHAKHNDIITQIGGGLSTAPEDAAALKAAIETMACLPQDEKASMGRKNHEYVKAYHDWRLLARKLAEGGRDALS